MEYRHSLPRKPCTSELLSHRPTHSKNFAANPHPAKLNPRPSIQPSPWPPGVFCFRAVRHSRSRQKHNARGYPAAQSPHPACGCYIRTRTFSDPYHTINPLYNAPTTPPYTPHDRTPTSGIAHPPPHSPKHVALLAHGGRVSVSPEGSKIEQSAWRGHMDSDFLLLRSGAGHGPHF